jgi:hypothetical protein
VSQDVVCLLEGRYPIDSTIIPRLAPDSAIVIKALGSVCLFLGSQPGVDGSAILDGIDAILSDRAD